MREREQSRRGGPGELRYRHEGAADGLRQALDEGGDLFLQEARHQPFARGGGHLVEGGKGHQQGDAVILGARVEAVGEGKAHAGEVQFRREVGGVGAALIEQVGAGQVQQARRFRLRFPAPFLEGGAVVDALRDAVVEPAEQGFLVHRDAGVAGAVGKVVDLLQQLAVVQEEGGTAFVLALHQGAADEEFARLHRVDGAVMHLASVHHRQAVQGGAHARRHVRRLLRPMRIGIAHLEQVAGGVLDPLRLDFRHRAGVDAARLDDFRGHHPLGFLLHAGAGEERELHVAGAEIDAVLGEHAQVAEQAGQEGLVQCRVASSED
ncbi:MAG: hypothetical protein FD132_662 [bacterium]|nr:MAG: hypothetical protein FD132_662 [bacterium]